MKIYINWDNREWNTDEELVFEELIEYGVLKTYSEFLAIEYEDCLDELLDLSEKEKSDLYGDYKMNLRLDFEDEVKNGNLNYTILNVETKDELTIKEIS